MKFKTTLLLAGKNATGVEIPPAVVAQLNAAKKPPVNVTINSYS